MDHMEQDVYAHYKPKHWTLRWFYRLFGLLLIWTSITMPASVQLIDTPLVLKLQTEYPTWFAVLKDIFFSIIILGGISIVLNFFLKYARHRNVSKKIVSTLHRLDTRAFSHFLSFLFFVTRWIFGIILALALWYTIVTFVQSLLPDILRAPTYETQPVVFVMGILGLTLIIESINLWQRKMRRYFHLRYHY